MTSPVFLELQRLVRALTEELATFRRRALQAEGRLRELEEALAASDARVGDSDGRNSAAASAGGGVADAARLDALERENASLRARLDGATERTRELLERVRFLRQQQEQEAAR